MARIEPTLRARAMRFLSRREHSRAELARKLVGYVEEGDDLTGVLDELAAKGWLSDARYAEQVIRSKSRRFGPVKLEHQLRAKGLDDEAIAAGVRAAGADGVSSLERVWRSRFHAFPADEREKARQVRFLLGRGFRNEDIFRFLRRGEAST